MAEITLVEAVNLALHHEMARDPDVVVLGEDVGVDGGVFRATLGLLGKFGPQRVLDTPLAETVIAVRHAAEQALERARGGGGPTLIEAVTYRLTDHTTADDAKRYRSEQEVSEHWACEPLSRLRAWLVAKGVWGKEDEEALILECSQEVQAAADEYLALPPPPPEAMFDRLYASLPASLAAQRNEALRFAAARRAEKGHGHG